MNIVVARHRRVTFLLCGSNPELPLVREGKSLRQYMVGCHSGRTGWRRTGAYRQSLPLSQRDRPSLLLNPGMLVLARLVVEL